MWSLPVLVIGLAVALSLPLGLYLARVLDRPASDRPERSEIGANWLDIERLLDTGPQGWKQYCLALLGFNVLAFVVGFAVLALQPWLPLNPDGKGMLAPSTIF